MRYIDVETWSRRDHFKSFSLLDQPHFNMCANMDLSAFHPFVKRRGISFTVAIAYLLARAANAIPEFRYRIRPGEVVEHEVVNPSATIMGEGDLFSFCTMKYDRHFPTFMERALERIAHMKAHPTVAHEPPGEDDLLFMTAIPWVSFTSFMHPMHLHPVDSVPRFAWGKFFPEGESLKMPLSVQGHHALMDGLHMGRFYAEMQTYLDRPEAALT